MKRILPILFCLYTTVIPATEAVNIVTVGAKGDGKTDNTQIIQRAIDEASARQEQVFIPAGTFVTGPLLLKSNIARYSRYRDIPKEVYYMGNVGDSGIPFCPER